MKNDPKIPPLLLLCASLFFLAVGSVPAAADGNSTYVPADVILLNCGASGQVKDPDGRNWTGDVGSNYAPSLNSPGITAPSQGSSVPAVPYMTARVFTSPFTYSFPLGPGRVFLRLHLYPSDYAGRNASDALFAVTAGPYTLLSNFSASLTADDLGSPYFMREYSINASATGGALNLTFAPSNHSAGSYAFVNGIEIVSIPEIFSTATEASLVGAGGFTAYPVDPKVALQTMYRLNVGGRAVSPVEDSGLYRRWDDDTPYLLGAATGAPFSNDPDVSITYTDSVPRYIAPVPVYATARQMSGQSPTVNMQYNLTWSSLQVDDGFNYLVRMHFCEIQHPMTSVNLRVFDIYLSNQTAKVMADVIGWSGGIGRPTYQDYVVFTSGTGLSDLWVALHPDTQSSPAYVDVILNGLEIFKLQKNGGNLAGLNPEPQSMSTGNTNGAAGSNRPPGKRKGSKAAIVGGVVGAVVVVVVVLLGLFWLLRRLRRQKKGGKDVGTGDGPSGWPPLSLFGNSHSTTSAKTSAARSYASSLPSNLCRRFSFAEIVAATNGFEESRLLGVGGFGKVYRGEIDGGATTVAIKRGNSMSGQGAREFRTEIEMLSKLRHRHLVSLIGFCEENSEMILVYDHMANGTLRDHLYKTRNPALPWRQRLEICIGAARGLHYLHSGAKHPIIHRDVKTTNILLDDKWVAKVSDFGISKDGPGMDDGHVSTSVKGSIGYLDPEYLRWRQLTEKSDVYSFGVVLFEVLCARPAMNPALPREQVSLADWALLCKKKGVLHHIVDPALKGQFAPQSLKQFVETAAKCLADAGGDRPSMGDVLWSLDFALQLQDGEEESGSPFDVGTSDEGAPLVAAAGKKDPDDPSTTTTTTTSTSNTEGQSLTSEDSNAVTPSAVFSQIANPTGR